MNDFENNDEISSIFEIIMLVIFLTIGMIGIQSYVRTIESKLDLNDNLDKVYSDTEYEDITDEVFRFTPYQAYMLGYYMDNWGPYKTNDVVYHNEFVPSQTLALSPNAYGGILVQRNNMISGANNTNPSVRSVMDSIRGGAAIETFWRTGTLYLSFTDKHSSAYNVVGDDNVSIIEFNKKDYSWIIDQTNHRISHE